MRTLRILILLSVTSLLVSCSNLKQQEATDTADRLTTVYSNCVDEVDANPKFAGIAVKKPAYENNRYSPAQLADSSYPSDEEVKLLQQRSEDVEVCRNRLRSSFSAEGFPNATYQIGAEQYWSETNISLSKLMLRELTWGEYAQQRTEIINRLDAINQQRQQQRAAQAAVAEQQQRNAWTTVGTALLQGSTAQPAPQVAPATTYVKCQKLGDFNAPIMTYQYHCPVGYVPM